MNLNEYINLLQQIVEEDPKAGELEVYYSKDEEGNGYYPVFDQYVGDLAYIYDDGEVAILDDELEEDEEELIPNAIIIN